MKVFISADIEGVTNVTNWDECKLYHEAHAASKKQMTREVAAACRGAISAGATEIVVKDGHGSARNIIAEDLPEEATLIRGWSNSPETMMFGLDESFDAVIYIGYHSGANYDGNPLAHTMNKDNNYVRINGMDMSEFDLNTLLAAQYGVPAVFLSGDKNLCNHAKDLVPSIETVAVKDAKGNATINMNGGRACALIESGVKAALKNMDACRIEEPETYNVEICYKEPVRAYRASFYPGVEQIDARTVRYTAENAFEMMRTRMFIL